MSEMSIISTKSINDAPKEYSNDRYLPWSNAHSVDISGKNGGIHPSADIWWETIYIAGEKYYVVSNGNDIEVIEPTK